MKKFRKKPVVIEAIQFTKEDHEQVLREVPIAEVVYQVPDSSIGGQELWLRIQTLEGTMYANLGDWIIKGVEGEFYPCKPEIFEKTYEAVDETV